jgi:hypothetical protein
MSRGFAASPGAWGAGNGCPEVVGIHAGAIEPSDLSVSKPQEQHWRLIDVDQRPSHPTEIRVLKE